MTLKHRQYNFEVLSKRGLNYEKKSKDISDYHWVGVLFYIVFGA
jgi:hypothetical protein